MKNIVVKKFSGWIEKKKHIFKPQPDDLGQVI